MNKCRNCGKNTEKMYCNGACKVHYYRSKGTQCIPKDTDVPQKIQDVPDVSVPAVSLKQSTIAQALPDNYGLADCACWHCRQNRSQPEARQLMLNHGPYKTASELEAGEINRVSLPGDIDYSLVKIC